MDADPSRPCNAQIALREAARAIDVARTGFGREVSLSSEGFCALAGDLVEVLEGITGLLRTTGLGVQPASNVEHVLHAVLQQLSQAASLARRSSGHDDGAPAEAQVG